MRMPPHISAALDVVEPYSKASVADAADLSGFSGEVFGLSGEEFASALAEDRKANYMTRRAPAVLKNWAFFEISSGTESRFRALVVPPNPSGPPPTAAGEFLVESWVENRGLVVDRSLLEDVVVTCEESNSSSLVFYHQFSDAWIVALAAFQDSVRPPKWLGANTIQIAPNARLLKGDIPELKFTNLLIEAISETKSKWRFLALYRIFEHGYLSEILLTIQQEFFRSPKETLDTCRNSVESEVRQFNALCISSKLEANFELFLDGFEKAKNSLNRYAFALDKSLNKDGQLGQLQGKAAKGVLICYKIRCSIVHSGLSAPIFEAYPDAADCLEMVLADLEMAALAFLGISVS